jgi:toxin ParE1/3/4
MPANISFHYLAAKEYRQARSWYLQRSRRTALRFMEAVDKGMEQIAARPELWPFYDQRHQWFKLRKFPYLLVFRKLTPEHFAIVAVAHSSRRPGYWRRRRFRPE